jgi:hypothetical protein
MAIVCITGGLGCRDSSNAGGAPSPELPEAIRFEVDGPGVQYFYRDSHAGTGSTRTAASVPLEHRGAVRVYDSASMADLSPTGGSERVLYVADLFDVRSGETVRARRMSRQAYSARSLAGELAHNRGVRIELIAREMAKMAPGSTKARKARKARELFKEMLPDDSDALERLERRERSRHRARQILRDERHESSQ